MIDKAKPLVVGRRYEHLDGTVNQITELQPHSGNVCSCVVLEDGRLSAFSDLWNDRSFREEHNEICVLQPKSAIKPGLHTHYKGGLYHVLGVAISADNGATDTRVVVYVDTNGNMFTRTEREFSEHVETAAYRGPRFWPFKKVEQ